ncbi:unnamed protein product [Ixodes hexagonus]
MIPGSEAPNGARAAESLQWGQKVPSSSDEMVTLTKAQLQKLLRALGANEMASLARAVSLQQHYQHDKKRSRTSVTALPNWARRNSTTTPHGSMVPPGVSQPLATFPRRLSSSHPELGSNGGSRPLSMLEQKQLQWEKERAEMQDWNPWGRPGAGAPRCQLVAAVPPSRTDVQVLRVQGTAASSNGPYQSRAPSPPVLPHLLPPGNVSPAFVRRAPPYLKSNVPFGPSYDSHGEEKEDIKRRWLQDLECQREENHRRRLVENQRSSISNGSCWADNESVGSERAQRAEDCVDSVWSYARAQASRGGATEAKGPRPDERKQRAMEYQRAIQAQMEEKQRKLQAEKAARLQEEREQERRLEEERQRLEEQYQEEQRRLREKKAGEREERTRLVLIAKMQQAEAEAEAVRKAKRNQKLQRIAPATPPESAAPQFTTDTGGQGSSVSTERASSGIENFATTSGEHMEIFKGDTRTQRKPQQEPASPTAAVRPMRSDEKPETMPQPQREISSQTEGSIPVSAASSRSSAFLSYRGPSPYIENRVLTPTKVRIAHRARLPLTFTSREFGIQTDISLPCGWNSYDPPRELAASVQSSAQNSPGRQARRVQHSRPFRAIHNEPLVSSSHAALTNFLADRKLPPRILLQMRGGNNRGSPERAGLSRNSASQQLEKLQEARRQQWDRNPDSRRLRITSRAVREGNAGTLLRAGRGPLATRAVDNGRARDPVKVPTHEPGHFDEESQHDANTTTQSDDEDSNGATLPATPARHSLRSPPVPALRKKIDFPSPQNRTNFAMLGSPPPTRKRWHSQEVYIPRQSFGDSSTSQGEDWTSSPGRHDDSRLRPVAAERHRSVSVTGCGRVRNASPSPVRHGPRSSSQDPLVHPEIVTGRPTPRQDKILQQLSSLRQGLLIKQREMENNLLKSKT